MNLADSDGLIAKLEGSGNSMSMTLFDDMRLADMESVNGIGELSRVRRK